MATVIIDGVTYETYADVATADNYLAADFSLNSVWTALTTDQKGQALVTSTRIINRQNWQGEPNPAPGSILVWPRTGVKFADGTAVPSDSIPQQIIDGSILLAALIAQTPQIAGQANTGSNIESVRAGSVQVDFFRPTTGTQFPTQVQQLWGQFLESGSQSSIGSGSVAFGTNDKSQTPCQNTFGTDFGLSEGYS